MTPHNYPARHAYQGQVAQTYDALRQTEPLWQAEQTFVETLVQRFKPGASILDVPAGTGRFLELFFRASLRVHAADISRDMLNELERRRAKLEGNLTVHLSSAEDLPLADGSMDFLISWRFVHLVPIDALMPVLLEFRRVCAGRIFIQVLPVLDGHPPPLWKRNLRTMLGKLRRLVPGKHQFPWSNIAAHQHYEAELLECFNKAGLKVEEVFKLPAYLDRAVRVYGLSRSTD